MLQEYAWLDGLATYQSYHPRLGGRDACHLVSKGQHKVFRVPIAARIEVYYLRKKIIISDLFSFQLNRFALGNSL